VDLAHVAAALQQQVDQVRGYWKHVPAAVVTADPAAAAELSRRPRHVRIVDRSRAGLGVHLDYKGVPYAEVSATPDWVTTASHEVVEMMVDPYGHRFAKGPSVNPADGGVEVSYLVEVADPCEAITYELGGVTVSDFVTPAYYSGAPGRRDHLGAVKGRLEVLAGGYISWVGPDRHWHQLLPGNRFVRSERQADVRANARGDRDRALPDAETDAA
jgi:hypothetical protein